MTSVHGDSSAMSVDAAPTVAPTSPSATNKRKREDSATDERDDTRIKQVQRDLLPVLERYD
jgi:hypothetical protein